MSAAHTLTALVARIADFQRRAQAFTAEISQVAETLPEDCEGDWHSSTPGVLSIVRLELEEAAELIAYAITCLTPRTDDAVDSEACAIRALGSLAAAGGAS